MGSPVSFGDAILIGKLAWRLGQAFTTGRKSAPKEFREVESQLYSLSKALDALGRAQIHRRPGISASGSTSSNAASDDSQATVNVMLQSCRECLEHLERKVTEYSSMTEERNRQQPRFLRWSEDLKKNWKKIIWTTEGGGLDTLRNQLTTHTNALNLILGVATHNQVERVESGVEALNAMLREIHGWFLENLKGTTASCHNEAEATSPQQNEVTLLQDITFQLYLNTGHGTAPRLLCSRASLRSSLLSSMSQAEYTRAFECKCNSHEQERQRDSTRDATAAYAISRATFPVRIAATERSWLLYMATDTDTNRVVSLTIKGVSVHGVQKFEHSFIQRLANVQTARTFQRGESNMLAYVDPILRIGYQLSLVADVSGMSASIESITFCGLRSYKRTSVAEVQILHYKQFAGFASANADAITRRASENPYPQNAEIILHFKKHTGGSTEDVNRIVLKFTRPKKPVLNKEDTTVVIRKIECTGLAQDQFSQQIGSIDVTFQFSSSQAANVFHEKIEAMRTELFVMDLQYQRPDEESILTIQASQVRTKDMDIPDASITIVQNAQTQCYRMIIVSRNNATILSQELPPDFFSSLAAPNGPNFRHPAYCAQLERNGEQRLFVYREGFDRLEFSHESNSRLFELGLASISGSLPLRSQSVIQART